MNNLRIEVGEKFVGKHSKCKMEIVRIERDEAVIKELDTGRQFSYGIAALRRCELERIEGDEDAN